MPNKKTSKRDLDTIYHALLILPIASLQELANRKYKSRIQLASKILVDQFGESADKWLNSTR